MRITNETLTRIRACEDQVQIFSLEWPDGCEVTVETILRAYSLGLNVDYVATKVLRATTLAEYERARATASDKYERATAPAWVEHKRATDSALAEYLRARDSSAWALYERTRTTALAEYLRALSPAWAEYSWARATPLVKLCSDPKNIRKSFLQ